MIAEAGTGSIIVYIFSGLVIGFILYSFLKARKQMNRPPSENVKVLDGKNFSSVVNKGVSLIDFWAAWCGPCKVQGPIVDDLADEIGDRANICKVDVDSNQAIAQKFGVQNIPTILILKDGRPVERFVGVKPRQVLLKAIHAHL